MLLNLSNHPSEQWSEAQKAMARQLYGFIVDMPFPAMDPRADTPAVAKLAADYASRCLEQFSPEDRHSPDNAVHIMGELTFCYALVAILQKQQVTCIASTSRRMASQDSKGQKVSVFSFERFREYPAANE